MFERRKLVPINNEPGRRPRCTLLGSFRHKPLIDSIHILFERNGIEVPAPPLGRVTEEQAGFKILEVDDTTKVHWLEIENQFMRSLTASDVGYLVNPDGYIGMSTGYELAWALAHGIPVYGMEPVTKVANDDPRELIRNFVAFSARPMPVDNYLRMVKSGRLDITDHLKGSYTPPKKRKPPADFVATPIARIPGSNDDFWKAFLLENEIPERLVSPGSWPFPRDVSK